MKILLLELSGSDSCARQPSRYSGAGPTMRRLVENVDNSSIAAEESCFEGDTNNKCISLSKADVENIRNHQPLNPYLFGNDYDVIVYANPGLILNTQKPQICWTVGAYEEINPEIKYLLVHNLKWQKPQIKSPNTKIHEFVLGIDIPPFQEYEKESFIFSCGNQYPQVNSHILARWAVKNKIKVVFAGPIDPTYKQIFLNEIDYNWATYIGQIDETEKIKLMKKARCYIDLVSHPINGPRLSVKSAWSYGCSVISTPVGVMPEVIEQNKNGFIIKDELEFVDAFKASSSINQKDCWNTSNKYSIEKMVESFKKVVNEISLS